MHNNGTEVSVALGTLVAMAFYEAKCSVRAPFASTTGLAAFLYTSETIDFGKNLAGY